VPGKQPRKRGGLNYYKHRKDKEIFGLSFQDFGSGSGSDPDSTRSVDPDPGGQKLLTKIEFF
jgi:hypothetical protein